MWPTRQKELAIPALDPQQNKRQLTVKSTTIVKMNGIGINLKGRTSSFYDKLD